MRGYLVILVALGIACGKAETPTVPAPGPVTSTSFGFFNSGNVQLSYRLDLLGPGGIRSLLAS